MGIPSTDRSTSSRPHPPSGRGLSLAVPTRRPWEMGPALALKAGSGAVR